MAAVAGFALTYFVLCRLSLAFVFRAEGTAGIWPAAGVALAALLLLGRSLRCPMLLAIGIANLAASLLVARPLGMSAAVVFVNLVQALVGEWIYRRLAGRSLKIDTLRRSAMLIFAAVPISAAVG